MVASSVHVQSKGMAVSILMELTIEKRRKKKGRYAPFLTFFNQRFENTVKFLKRGVILMFISISLHFSNISRPLLRLEMKSKLLF